MINIEEKVFSTVATALRAAHSPISVYGEAVEVPASFPCVTLEMADNPTYRKTQDDSLQEHHAQPMFSVNAYSNLSSGKKSQAKAIMNLIDEQMQGMGFTRTMVSPVANADRSIYRITARYTAVVAAGVEDGQNTTYQIFRR